MRQDTAVIETVAFSVGEVRRVLSQIKPDKSPGPDGIPGLILKELSKELAKPLSTLFELSMRTGRLPSQWKTANLVPLYKGGSRMAASCFRPISLTCLSCKTMEALVKSAIQQFCEENNLLQDFQHGFRRGRSCLSNLLACLEIWTRALEEGFEADVVYIDFSKAFDTVPHQRLLHKLSAIGIRGDLLNWIGAFLVGRKQRVCIGDDMSEWVSVTSGVPQGSVLGPLLFLLYVNDSLQELDCGKIMFADDVKLWQVIKSPNDQRSLQNNLHRLQAWSEKWLLVFNVQKQQRGDLILVYKIINGLEHGLNFEDMFQWHLSPNLRGHSMELRTTMSRLNLRSEFFTQRVVEKWKDLPQSVVEATSLQLFKKRLDDYLCPLFSLDSLNLS
nr:unnamed protein product [Spirometra erinaceieuropaei]